MPRCSWNTEYRLDCHDELCTTPEGTYECRESHKYWGCHCRRGYVRHKNPSAVDPNLHICILREQCPPTDDIFACKASIEIDATVEKGFEQRAAAEEQPSANCRHTCKGGIDDENEDEE